MQTRFIGIAAIAASALVARSALAATWSAPSSGVWENPANWTPSGNPTTTDQMATFADSIGYNSSTITLTEPEAVTGLLFEATGGGSYNLTGSPLSFVTGTQSPFILVGNANINPDTISSPVILTEDLTISDAVGTLRFTGGISGTGQIFKTGPGAMTIASADVDTSPAYLFSGQVTLSSAGSIAASTILLGSTAKLMIGVAPTGITVQRLGNITIAGGSISFGNNTGRTLLVTPSLTAGTGSTVDIKANDLDLTGQSLVALTAQVTAGFNLTGGANWQGSSGITSSTAAANSAHLTAVAVVQNNQSGTTLFNAGSLFDGTAPNPADVLVKYTYFGDANLDGKVDGSDYALIDNGYASNNAATGWFNGDFNYDGVIDGSDYTLIDNAFNNQTTAIKSTAVTAVVSSEAGPNTTAVPEPATAAVGIGMTAVAKLRRRRRVSERPN